MPPAPPDSFTANRRCKKQVWKHRCLESHACGCPVLIQLLLVVFGCNEFYLHLTHAYSVKSWNGPRLLVTLKALQSGLLQIYISLPDPSYLYRTILKMSVGYFYNCSAKNEGWKRKSKPLNSLPLKMHLPSG